MMASRNLLPWFLLLCSAVPGFGAPLFEDGFESGALGSAWSVSATNQGRSRITTDHSPATGSYQLVLDDSSNDAIYSVAEATLTLDLTGKRSVVLSFNAKSLGNEANVPPTGNFTASTRNYDGVAISADGGSTWRSVQSLAGVPTSWKGYSVTLDSSLASLGGSFGPDFRIRFSGYDNSPAPIDGIAIDDVVVTAVEDQRLLVELPDTAAEGTGTYTGYVLTAIAPADPLTVTLTTSPSGQIALPATVIIPAGQTYQSFSFSVNDDSLANGSRTVTFNATATGATAGSGSMTVTDDDVAKATLVLPAQLTEGETPSGNATLSLDRVFSSALVFTLGADLSNELTLPASVSIPAGQTSVAFTVRATNDTRIDGDQTVTVTASSTGTAPVSATTHTVDNESRALTLSLPATLLEGSAGIGSVTLAGTLTEPLIVTISSAQASSISFPATVTIPAGQTQATFTLTATDNTVRDGSRDASLTIQATGLTSATQTVTIRDNEVASYRFGTLTDIVNISSPVAVTLTAADIEGNPLSNLPGSLAVSVVLPDGSTLPTTLSGVTTSGSTRSANVTLPSVATAPLRLRVSDASGSVGDSSSFDIMRVMPLVAGDLAWDAGRNRIYASVPAATGGTNANKVLAIDPQTFTVTGSVTTNQDPGELSLTSGGEYLYAALNSNGTVAKINPATMSVASTFSIGVSQYYGTLYAEDMSTVAGQPDLLVVSQYRKNVSPRHNGVAVYDKGVIRPVMTPDHTGSNVIEPSSDPTVFFGQNTETTEYGFRTMKIDANGITVTKVTDGLIAGFSSDMRSDGNLVFSMSGIEIDGSQSRKLGSFGTGGVVRPDLASNRVYFVEPSDPTYYFSALSKLSAYDPNTLARIKSLTLPVTYDYDEVKSFIRWGANGLAFRSADSVILINSSQLVPSEPPADLAVSMHAMPNPASVGSPLTFTVQVTNQGPNVARGATVTTTLSDSQTLVSAVASTGTPVVAGSNIVTPVGQLAVGATATLTITTTPLSAGSLTCTASAGSLAVDPNSSNNLGFQLVSVGFRSGVDSVNLLRLAANNLVYDPTRKLFWATIPATVPAPLGRSVVSIDPLSGMISAPIAVNATPMGQSMAISANGRYLFIGLSDSPEIHRLDLSANPISSTRIALGPSQWNSLNYAEDIEVLDGDGTSFLMTGTDDDSAAAYDGSVMRNHRSGIYTVDCVERCATPDTFIGYDNSDTGFGATRLAVTADGVTITQTVSNVISGFNVNISGEGNLVLSSNGSVINSGSLSLKSSLGLSGCPVVDSRYQRAYLVTGNAIHGYEAGSGVNFGNLAFPATQTGVAAQSCTRWGSDGFGVLGGDGNLYIARWSASIPDGADQNADGIPDTWASQNYDTIELDPALDTDGDQIPDALEYFFGTDPNQKDPRNPLHSSTVIDGSQTTLHLTFPRRMGIQGGRYETSTDLVHWSTASDVTEAVLSTQTVGGVQTQTVDAAVPVSGSGSRYIRLAWGLP